MKLFYIQLVASFLVGGGMIMLQSLLAEKANEKISGIILTLPSTSALGFFFLGWSTSSEEAAQVVPATLIPLGVAILFPVLYLACAHAISKLKFAKLLEIFLTFSASIACFIVFAILMAIYRFSNFWLGIAVITFSILLAHGILHTAFSHREKTPPLIYTKWQKLGRAAFGGLIVLLVVLFGKILNPFWGGVFVMFPATFSSTLMIFHYYYNPENLLPLIQKIPLGSPSFLAYALTVKYTFPHLGFILGTVAAYAVSLVISFAIAKLSSR